MIVPFEQQALDHLADLEVVVIGLTGADRYILEITENRQVRGRSIFRHYSNSSPSVAGPFKASSPGTLPG